ncbi:excinuclease ABC subunit UvrC [Fusobacterium perfoetens]|uniref:excinuclease ABC subunit UvrC n=1 Tax=Fusobacterium perfoetens TaxID=852 RepID=UPI0004884C2B|nr:excinuclease ABC subunit UvrC [Fusobacterium perfoetens]
MDIKKYIIPENPGVYLMKKNNEVIYVGKAKNLKRRVYSYFFREHEDEKTRNLVKNIEDIETIICNSEIDAFVLENNLIKRYSPKYNILLKDEKTYPYIKISKEKFPKISIVRSTRALDTKSGEYFGPYPQGAWNLKKILVKLFKIRDCNKDMNKISQRPCLKYYMKMCDGPCKYKDIEEKYKENVENIIKILKGHGEIVLKLLQEKMKNASEKMMFEEAIFYRNQSNEIKNVINNQVTEYGKGIDEDVFSIIIDGDLLFLCVLNMREGKILGKTSSTIKLKDKIYGDIFQEVVREFYSKHPIPKNIIFQAEYIESDELIKEWLKLNKHEVVHTYYPKIDGRRKKLLDMALLNINKDIIDYYNKKTVIEEGMEKLYKELNLKNYPRKIECFDISNIQGKDAVASMAVAVEGKASKKDYRKFKIECKDTPDDFQMMREVITRRYSKLEPEKFPDIILIDGGLGQINAAGKILEEIGRNGISDLLSIAKKEELIYKYGEDIPYRFSHSDEALKILIRVRDETHRFGITYHRKLRSKRVLKSELDDIKGIGEIRKEKLLKKFGSVKKIKEATLNELKDILPEKIAIELLEKIKK